MKKYFLFLAAFFQLFLCSVTLSAFGRQEIVAELERELNYWIRSLYPYELKKISWVKYQVELMPGRREYSLQYYDEKVKIDMPDHIDLSFLAVPDLALPNLGHITFATKRKYSAGVSSDFLRLFETEDALFAFIGVQALQKDVFRSDFSSILTEGEVGIIAEIMLKAKMNPYGYLEFLKNLHRFTNKNLNRKAPDLSKVKAILDKITGYDDAQQRKLTPLPASFLAKNYFETTIQNLVQTLVSPEGPPIVIADSSMNDEIDFSISYKPEGRTYTLLIPKKWDQAFASEDQFAALVTYGVLWKKAWDEKEDHDHWGAEEIAKLDMKVIDSLVKNLKISDSIGVHSLNPSEYYALLTRINLSQMKKSHASPQEKFQFKGFIEEISKTLQANTIDPSVRISVVQAYLQKIQIQYANEFLETHPIPILNEKRTFTKTLEIKPNPKTKRCLRDSDEDDETIEETESKQTKVLTYSELVNFISSHGDISNLDLIASKLVVQIPEEELTLPVIIKLFNEQEALPITTLSALNTYLSRISDDDWPEWNSVYDLIAKNGPVKTVEGYSFPGELCKAWERNHLKLLHGQIETSDLSSSSGRSELVQKLKNFSKTLGPCSNKQSETKIFKLLMDSDKIDRDFLIEWDTENRFEHENNKILLKKEVSPQFLQSKAFNTVDLPSKLAVKTIRTLPEDILDLDSLKDMDSRNIHPDYLNALVRRATELYRDPEDLVKLYSFILSKQPSLEKIPQQVYAQIVAATIREGKVTPENLLPPQNCHYSEPILDALVESSYSRVQSLYVISKIHGCQDLMKRYLMKKPFESFRDLIFFTLEFASYANQGILREIKTQELIFDQIGRQIPSGEYTLSNLKRFQNALLGSSGDSERTEHSEDVAENSDDPIESEESEESVSSAEKTDQKESQVRIPGLHYLFFVALKQFEDPEELALVHRIWLATTVQTDSKLASALLNEKASARNGYLKMVIGALEAEDQELILKYPMFSKSKVRKAVFRHLLDSSLSNEFIQRWIEAVFEGDAASSKRMQEREAYMETLHQKRPTRTLEEASQILNQTNYQGGDQISIWRDMKYLLRTVPSSEFTSKRVHRFVKSLDKDLAKIGSLAANAWLLKYTPEDKQTELSLIFHDIQQQQDIAVNRMFCRLLETNYQKMARAVIRENPQDLSELFTPSSFSLLNGSKCSINRSWTRELFELLEEEEIDREAVISWLAKYEELTLSRDFILAKRSQLNDLSSDLSHIPDGTFKQTLASKLVFGLEQDAFTWETVTSFWKTNPSISSASLEAVLRFMANTKDAGTLAKIHSFLAKHTREIDVNLSKKGCNLLRANFKRMLEGSFGQQEANDGLMEFTPAWLGCYSPGKFTETKHKDLATVLKIAIETGATSPEKLLAESDSFDKSQHQFRELGRQFFKKLDEVRDFQELGRLLSSAKEEGQSFLIPFSISDRILKKFASTEFERSKIEPIFKYLGNIHDRVQVLSWLIDRTQNDSDLEFALLELLKDGTASLSSLSGTLFRKLMLGSIRHNSENILLFPIETELIEKFGSKWLGKNWYNDRLIREVIHDWQGPKEYLLAWLKHLPSEFNKRDKAFRYFIKHAGIRSFEEWDHILTLAEKLEKPWMKDAPAVDHAAKALWSETNLRTLFKNLPDEQLASHKIVLFVLSDSSGKLQIDKSYALNWAMSKAVTPEDFVEIHENLRTQKHPEVSPEFSMISLLYRTAYTKMLKAVMDLEPESILDFYDLPIQKEVLEGYLSEALATRVRDDVLDELTTHLLSISKNLPSGVAWAWIDKNIPEKAEKLRRGTPNPKIPRTEALVQFAAKRGVLTFKDIPGEIKSAQNFHKEFNLPAKTQEAILQALPEESFTLKNLQSYAAMDDVWIKQGLGTSLLADPALGSAETFFEQQLRKRKDQQKLLATYQETKKIISENPILIYDLENSEKMQHLFINKMKEGGAWPKNFQKQHQILLSLAKRGPSE
ncbi:MAG TPA: hypothetical protein VEL47_05205, partial [Myxococcota bacterium]|nr:hypothetical protein [Myxococcota bacterium]